MAEESGLDLVEINFAATVLLQDRDLGKLKLRYARRRPPSAQNRSLLRVTENKM